MHRLTWWIDDTFIPALTTLREVISGRLLPTFDNLDKEAERISADAWERLGSRAGPDSDPGDLAETAEEAGINHYLMLSDTRQGLLNMFAVAIYHHVEQQQITLVRRELLPPDAEDEPSKMKPEEFVRLLQEASVDVTAFPQWEKLHELRLVANVAKHAEGPSAEELEKIRPDLLVAPSFRPEGLHFPQGLRHMYQPLSGDDLYVAPPDLEAYFEAAIGFWRELSSRVRAA